MEIKCNSYKIDRGHFLCYRHNTQRLPLHLKVVISNNLILIKTYKAYIHLIAAVLVAYTRQMRLYECGRAHDMFQRHHSVRRESHLIRVAMKLDDQRGIAPHGTATWRL